ncbi:uncharacterized protein [Rutidosis leptorrhynchoides]|uniref:uncharacterized protein n=1 Tax=Rutidosis leptorrhynchoides TaxID=125765 RepID=UPI003A993824
MDIKWDTILKSYGKGGLNVESLKAKNISLLCKWWWRFKSENNALWVNVIKSIYGRDGVLGSFTNGSLVKHRSVWWNIIKIRKDLLNLGIDVDDFFERKMGDGRDILFWENIWVRDSNLKQDFPRLFRLEVDNLMSVNERVIMDSGKFHCTWKQKRQLTGRLNGELQKLEDRVKSIESLREGDSKWVFKPSGKVVYSSRVIASIFDDLFLEGNSNEPETLRNNFLPLKLGIFVWRAIKNRLPTRVELEKRGVAIDTSSCPLCGTLGFSITIDVILEIVDLSSDKGIDIHEMLGAEFCVLVAEKEAERRSSTTRRKR